MDVTTYVTEDSFFGQPFLDADAERDDPLPHRYLHGGFEGTATRFAIYLPPKETWRGRFFQPLGGGQGGDEFSAAPWIKLSQFLGGFTDAAELGGYMVESNQGHIQSSPDPNADDPVTLYGYRASAESARFASFLATQYYGEAPRHGYAFAGGGGGFRCLQCMEQAPGVWDAALVFVAGGRVDPADGDAVSENPIIANFSAMLNVRNILGPRLPGLVDAFEPGGSGDPFAGLTEPQRAAVADLYALGFPGGEVHLGIQIGPTAIWATSAEGLLAGDPGYFDDFWTGRGYAGADAPELFAARLVHTTTTVGQVVTNDDLLTEMADGGPAAESPLANWWTVTYPGDLPVGVVPDEPIPGDLIGARVTILTGAAAGRRLYCRDVSGTTLLVDANGEAGLVRLTGVLPGDEIEVDNRDFLAFCHWYRHHVPADAQGSGRFVMHGRAIHPQRPHLALVGNAGGALTGRFQGKVLSTQFTPDTMVWPIGPAMYAEGVLSQDPGAADRFQLRWIENAENAPPQFFPKAHPALSTRLIDFSGVIRQGLHDLVAWVEDGAVPAATNYRIDDGQVRLAATARERGGIQPVVSATANDGPRAEAKVGEPVLLEVSGEVPPGAGRIVAVEWDFEGYGTFPFAHEDIDGSKATVTLTTEYAFSRPGTYFPAVRVSSHREGDVDDTTRRIENLARVRVVVS
jgi:hypothetical protein